jgi:hypothetical protein
MASSYPSAPRVSLKKKRAVSVDTAPHKTLGIQSFGNHHKYSQSNRSISEVNLKHNDTAWLNRKR